MQIGYNFNFPSEEGPGRALGGRLEKMKPLPGKPQQPLKPLPKQKQPPKEKKQLNPLPPETVN